MIWPTNSIPTYGRGVWLECNGQSFSTTQFPQLYETLGTNRVPNYQGMFLRGYGSQNFSQVNGDLLGRTSTTYSSGDVGQIQGDSSRENVSTLFYQQLDQARDYRRHSFYDWGRMGIAQKDLVDVGIVNMFYIDNSDVIDQVGSASYPFYPMPNDAGNIVTTSDFSDVEVEFYDNADLTWYNALTKYRYRLETTTSGEGEDATTSYELVEEEVHPELQFSRLGSPMYIVNKNEQYLKTY